MHALVASARNQVAIVLTRATNLATGVIVPLMLMSLLTLPRLHDLDPATATAVFTGVLLASFWGASLWSGAGILRRERNMGTLASSVTGCPSALTVLLGKTVGGVVFDIGLIIVTNVLFILATGIRLRIAQPVAFVAGVVAVVVCGVASSLMIGALLVLSRYAFQLTTALGTPVMLLGGTIIPHDVLPPWAAAIGNVINLAWLQRFMMSTATTPDWGALSVGLGLSAAYAAVGVISVRIMLRRARKEGSLDLA